MKRILSKRGVLVSAILLASLFAAIYFQTRPRLAPGQTPLVDIQNIETLRTQFNRDAGKSRLIILVSPT